MKQPMKWGGCVASSAMAFAIFGSVGQARTQAVVSNVRVTHDADSTYVSADAMAGGSYTDATLARCGVDRRAQNEPTLAIDPRNTLVQTAGSNDYCAVPTNQNAWAGFYRSTDGGKTWTDSLIPAYLQDQSPEGQASPLHNMALAGATAAGDPVQAWDDHGRLFYMGNNFNRGTPDGNSVNTRDDTGDVWVATYEPLNAANTSTDGQRYTRTVVLATNTFGQGSFNDKTGIAVDTTGAPLDGTVYAAWSDFHSGGCSEILFARSTDHGATFTAPEKISSSICGNQGPNIAVAADGTVYVSWRARSVAQNGGTLLTGAAVVRSTDGGQTFNPAEILVPYTFFTSASFSGNGARQCGDGSLACPSGFTFPRFDMAQPTLTTIGTEVDMALPVALASGQGQIQFTRSTDLGVHWSSPSAIDPQRTGHQFYPWITASGGRLSAIYYDSRSDALYSPKRPPCNSATGVGSACLNVWYSTSTDEGQSWTQTKLTTRPSNPNWEQFGGRQVPFLGDYIVVSAVGNTIAAAWTDQRDVVAGAEMSGSDGDSDDVAGDPEAGGSCTEVFSTCFDSTGGLDQNIYAASITP